MSQYKKVLASITIPQLSKLCVNCGINSSGATKSILIDRIASRLQQRPLLKEKNQNGQLNIVAIDMGIKNFSYCKLSMNLHNVVESSEPVSGIQHNPLVQEWKKLDTTNLLDVEELKEIETNEEFTARVFSKISFKVVNEIIFSKNFKPDLILIENQRLRSSSSKNVLQWILRVSMLENMLHSTIYTYQQLNSSLEKVRVISSSPQKMANYWVGPDLAKKKDAKSKNLRVDLVHSWMNSLIKARKKREIVPPFFLTKKIQENIDIALPKLAKTRSATKRLFLMLVNDPKETTQKGDDLVDSLLHALAWIIWEKNITYIKTTLEKNPDLLLDNIERLETMRERNNTHSVQ